MPAGELASNVHAPCLTPDNYVSAPDVAPSTGPLSDMHRRQSKAATTTPKQLWKVANALYSTPPQTMNPRDAGVRCP